MLAQCASERTISRSLTARQGSGDGIDQRNRLFSSNRQEYETGAGHEGPPESAGGDPVGVQPFSQWKREDGAGRQEGGGDGRRAGVADRELAQPDAQVSPYGRGAGDRAHHAGAAER